MSNLTIDEILKHNENYIGTYSKDNVPISKNNESTIINLQNSDKNGSHWVSYKKINNKIFYFDSYAITYIIKNQYPNHKSICSIYRMQSIDSNQCGRFCILFIKSNIKNENNYNNYNNFLLKFEKNNF